jgi:hypothetical protein
MDIFIGAYSLLRRRPHSAGARDDRDQRLMEAETARQSCGYATPTLAGHKSERVMEPQTQPQPVLEISTVGAAGDADLNRRRRLLQW